jgi:hypothetical protein
MASAPVMSPTERDTGQQAAQDQYQAGVMPT